MQQNYRIIKVQLIACSELLTFSPFMFCILKHSDSVIRRNSGYVDSDKIYNNLNAIFLKGT